MSKQTKIKDISDVLPLEELMSMTKKRRLNYFSNVMENFTVRDLCKYWSVSSSTLYKKYIPEIGYEKNTESSAKKAGRKKKEFTESTEPRPVGRPRKNTILNEEDIDNVKKAISNTTHIQDSQIEAIKQSEIIENTPSDLEIQDPNNLINEIETIDTSETITNITNDESNVLANTTDNLTTEQNIIKPSFANQEFNFRGKYDSSNLDSIYNKLRMLLDNGTLYDVEINIKETAKYA